MKQISDFPDNTIKNHHCTCVKINHTGIMIEGPSGSGKTSLALGLIEAAQRNHLEYALICDDQALLEVCDGDLIAHCPPALAGKIELFGHGIAEMNHVQKHQISLVCNQTSQNEITRMPEPVTCTRSGIELPLIKTPIRHESMGVRIVFQALGLSLCSIQH